LSFSEAGDRARADTSDHSRTRLLRGASASTADLVPQFSAALETSPVSINRLTQLAS